MSRTVTIVVDDKSLVDALGVMLRTKGHRLAAFARAAEMLRAPFTPGCVVAGVHIPETSGLKLLQNLKSQGDPRPFIMLAARSDIEMAMRAVKFGAFDVIEQPVKEHRLLSAIRSALDAFDNAQAERDEVRELRARVDGLTQRQRQTMELLVQGFATKDIASHLGISSRTVEIYRARVMSKIGVRSLAELVHVSIRLRQVAPGALVCSSRARASP